MPNSDAAWERFGQHDPYYGVATLPQFHGELDAQAREQFFRSGEEHVTHTLDFIRRHIDPNFAPKAALDFGCGVGRILVPLTSYVPVVVGVDVSPSMLAECERNGQRMERADRIELLPSNDHLSALNGRTFDLVHSYIVLQHIPARRGERIFAALLRLMAPGGVAAIHVTTGSGAGLLRRGLEVARARGPFLHNISNIARGRSWSAPIMEMNRYDLGHLLTLVHDIGCEAVFVELTNHGGHTGAYIYCHRPSSL